MDVGKIVRAKSKFKATPQGLGIGTAMSPICIGFKIDAAALKPPPGGSAEPP